jgi:glycosyltransferase Alg8
MAAAIIRLAALLSLNILVLAYLPNRIWEAANSLLIVTLGPLAIWRYSWWFLHLVRSNVYARLVFPKLRRRAAKAWSEGRRPPFVHFLVTTYREKPEITERVLESIFAECRRSGIPARIFVATGDVSDEQVIENYCSDVESVEAEIVIVRQNQPGKRAAMGLGLRALSRYGVGPNDVAIFMDGDSVIGEGAIESCSSLFAVNPKLGAVTTDEAAVVNGPGWIATWCDLRFAQRRIAMLSHSLSRKVLTLTGRLSIFRAPIVADEEFIRTVEADHLDHWLWGRFRFLSGDDKSTWFSLLSNGYEMLYVPDARVLTIENIREKPWKRIQQNLLRWSGNMLRNGSRALALGPRRCGLFVWWCVLDQRLSIWTSLSGLAMAVVLSLTNTWDVIVAYLVWVLITRTVVSMILFLYSRRISVSYPFMLYASQILASLIKIYLLFRVSKQRWLNRGDQRSELAGGRLVVWQNVMATFLTVLYAGAFLLLASFLTGALRPPVMP